MTSRPCDWCGEPLRPKQKDSCQASCRRGRWRWLRDERTGTGAPPPEPPWAESPLHGRRGELDRAHTAGPRSGVNARSGVMLSYRKTRVLLFERLSHFPGGERLIDEALEEALAPAQRRKLEARDAD